MWVISRRSKRSRKIDHRSLAGGTLWAVHIPEVNVLFVRPSNPDPFWYYQRQIECYQIARSHAAEKLVILDGDPFQPIWYNHNC